MNQEQAPTQVADAPVAEQPAAAEQIPTPTADLPPVEAEKQEAIKTYQENQAIASEISAPSTQLVQDRNGNLLSPDQAKEEIEHRRVQNGTAA